MKLISIHIPKNGGVSFEQNLREFYNDLFYSNFFNNDSGIKGVNAVARPFQVNIHNHQHIHGHFIINNFFGEDAIRITWMRDPLKRAPSQFALYKKVAEDATFLGSLVWFPNMQAYFMAGRLDHFDLVLCTDRYEESLERVATFLKWDHVPKMHRLNVTEDPYEMTPKDIELAERFNKYDIELYEQLMKRW